MERFWLYTLTHKANPLVWPALVLLAVAAVIYRIGLIINSLSLTVKIKTDAKIVSIGNITVGGSGKTPVTMALAKACLSKGMKTAIASGGYKRKDKSIIHGKGTDIGRLSIDQTGDELMLMAENLPNVIFGIAGSKAKAARMLDEKYQPDIILIDDGFQHRRLHRNYDLLLIDASEDITKNRLFPLGRLREPLSAIGRADLIILTKANLSGQTERLQGYLHERFPEIPILVTGFYNSNIISKNESIEITEIKDDPVFFFAGVAGYEVLANQVRDLFSNVVGDRSFADHCAYDRAERELITADIKRLGPKFVITTQKDFVKIRNFDFSQTIYYLDLQLKFEPDGESILFDRLDDLMNG